MAEVSHGDLELLQAAKQGSYADALTALDNFRADINAVEPVTMYTPLHYAVESGHLQLVRLFLIDHRAKFDVEDKKKKTAIARALELGHPKLLDIFIERGALKPPEQLSQDTLVNAAVDKDAEKVKSILMKLRQGQARLDLNYRKEKEMRTALHVAAAGGQRTTCELLLSAGAGTEVRDRDGQTPLFSAVQYKRVAIIELLLSKGAAVDVRNKHGYTALHRACRDGHPDVISAFFAKSAVLPAHVNLREMVSSTGQTCLFSAARSYRPPAVRLLLKDLKVNPAAQDQGGDTALHYICVDAVSEEKRSPRLETLKVMLEGGCPVNAVNNDGQTPIFKALLTPARELVECLVLAGANLRVQDKEGNTPLHIAASSQAADAEALVAILLRANLDIGVQNRETKTPLELAKTDRIRAQIRDYTVPPQQVASAPKSAAAVAPKKSGAASLAPKRKGSENEIIVEGEGDDAEEGEWRPKPAAAGGGGGGHQPGEKRPRREHSWQKQKDASAKSISSAGSDTSGSQIISASKAPSFSTPPPTPMLRASPVPAPAAAAVQRVSSAMVVDGPTEVKPDDYIAFEPHDAQPSAPAVAGPSPLSTSANSAAPKLTNSNPSPYVNMRDDPMSDPQRAASLGPIIEYSELTLTDVIGEGAFGSVRKGEWNLMPVAVKILHKSDPKATQMFYKEIRHKHIARYLGSCIRPPLCMVMEFYPESLMNRIAGKPLDIPTLLTIAHGVALAMLHLHSRKIIHRDIKPSNILLDEHLNPYVADFGVSREYGQPGTMTGIGTPLYMAPEMLTTKKYSEKVDQYAFAMLLWQMMTGKSVAKGFNDPGDDDEDMAPLQIAFRAATQGWRPPIPPAAPVELSQLIVSCWNHFPDKRPGFDKIASALQGLMVYHPRK